MEDFPIYITGFQMGDSNERIAILLRFAEALQQAGPSLDDIEILRRQLVAESNYTTALRTIREKYAKYQFQTNLDSSRFLSNLV